MLHEYHAFSLCSDLRLLTRTGCLVGDGSCFQTISLFVFQIWAIRSAAAERRDWIRATHDASFNMFRHVLGMGTALHFAVWRLFKRIMVGLLGRRGFV